MVQLQWRWWRNANNMEAEMKKKKKEEREKKKMEWNELSRRFVSSLANFRWMKRSIKQEKRESKKVK